MSLSLSELVRALADGRFHTGAELGRRFGHTRAAIWKAVRKLPALGLELHAVRGKGYRLGTPLSLLDASMLADGLSVTNRTRLQELEILPQVDSTNAHVLRRLQSGTLVLQAGRSYACLAEMQSAGRGRRGRQWISPFGHNLYMTLCREVVSGVAGLDGLSLVVGIALVQALRAQGLQGLGLKWPNDVLWRQRKVAGILIEITGDMSGVCQVVVGVGLNLKQDVEAMRQVSQPWAALEELGFNPDRRNHLFGSILDHQIDAVERFLARGFADFSAQWHELDLTRGQQLEISSPAGSVTGLGLGVDATGALLAQTKQGLQRFQGGEVSIRTTAAAVGRTDVAS